MNQGINKNRDVSLSPFEWTQRLWEKIPRHTKFQFCSAFVLGLLVHLYIITNSLPNHDSIWITYYDPDLYSATGRWFKNVPDQITGTYMLFALNRLFAIFYIAVSACLIGSCLEIRRPLLAIILSALMVSFPSVTCGFSYVRDSDPTFIAVMLSCLAVYISRRFRYGFLPGGLIMLFSLATYQAYIGFCAGLAVIMLMRDILLGRVNFKSAVVAGIKYMGALVIGAVLFVISLKTPLVGDMISYAGADSLGGITIFNAPGRFFDAYVNVFDVMLKDVNNYHQDYMMIINFKYMFLFAGILGILLIIYIVAKQKLYKNKLLTVLLAVVIALFPPACNLISVISPNHLYILMQYSLVLIFALALTLVDIAVKVAEESGFRPRKNVAVYLASWVILLVCTTTAVNYTIYANIAYFKLEILYEQGYAFSTALMARIQSEAFYRFDTPVILYGTPAVSKSTDYFSNMYGIPGASGNYPEWYSYNNFLNYYIGIDNVFYTQNGQVKPPDLPGVDELISQMPLYPAPGSIMESDGYIIVKFSE